MVLPVQGEAVTVGRVLPHEVLEKEFGDGGGDRERNLVEEGVSPGHP